MPGIVSATGVFHDWFFTHSLAPETISVLLLNYPPCIYLLYHVLDQPPKGGGIVTQKYVLARPVAVQYVLSTYSYWSTCHSFLRGLAVQQLLATHPPGFSGSHILDIYVIQCCTSTRHPTSHIHHTCLYKLIKPAVITQLY